MQKLALKFDIQTLYWGKHIISDPFKNYHYKFKENRLIIGQKTYLKILATFNLSNLSVKGNVFQFFQ